MSSLKSKFLYQVSVSFLYSVAPLIIFPYVSRVLGPAAIGKINFIDYASQFFILLASFGIPYYGVREVARSRNEPKQLSLIASELLGFHILVTVLSLLLFLLLIFIRPTEFTEKELIILAIINIVTNAFGLEWMIHGMEDFAFLAKRSFIIKILSLVAVFIFIQSSSDYLKYYVLLIGSNVVMLIIDIGYAVKKKIAFTPKVQIKKHIRPLSVFFLTTVSLSIYTFFDTVILGIISGGLAVGFYTTALKIIRISQNLINDVGSVMLPRVSYLISRGDKAEVNRITNKSFQYILTATIPFGVFLFLTAKEIILLLGGPQFLLSVDVLRFLSVLPLVIGLSNLFFLQVLLPHGKERVILMGVLLGSVVSIVANLILCPLYAQRGAALSCIAAEVSISFFLGIYSLKYVQLTMPYRLLSGIIISSLLFIPIISFCKTISDNVVIVFLAEALFCAIAFLMVQLLFRNSLVSEGIDFFLSKFRRKQLEKTEPAEV